MVEYDKFDLTQTYSGKWNDDWEISENLKESQPRFPDTQQELQGT